MTRTSARFPKRRPWSVDRWGRFLAGATVLLLTLLGIFQHRVWLAGTLLISVNLVVTSLTDRCLLHALLIYLGAREREDLFLPGGSLKPEVVQATAIDSIETAASARAQTVICMEESNNAIA